MSSLEKACPLLLGLISDTPWDRKFVESFLLCNQSSFFGAKQTSLLLLIEKYINISSPRAESGEDTTIDLPARAIYANLQFQLGKVEIARQLQKQVEQDLPKYAATYPSEDLSRISVFIDF